jgi:AcrR family transcriptional regulator
VPRIAADTIADHVALQEAAVFDAAIRLFIERGYQRVSLGDIATEVGLARNSLYRYFPDKAHILLRWFRTELPAQVARTEALLSGDEPPVDRLGRWIDDQLDYALRPEHELVAAIADVAPELDEDARRELADSHRQLFAPLDSTLRETGVRRAEDRSAIAALIGGLVLAAAEHEREHGRSRRVRRLTLDAVRGLLPAAG